MITEEQYLEAQNIITEYTKQLRIASVGRCGRWKCLLCGRDKFTHKSPHKCVGGYRKRKIIWEEIL